MKSNTTQSGQDKAHRSDVGYNENQATPTETTGINTYITPHPQVLVEKSCPSISSVPSPDIDHYPT